MVEKPPSPDRVTELTRAASDTLQRIELHRKRAVRGFVRVMKIAALMWLATVGIVVAMIATGNLFGPSGAEGLLATPLMLFAAYAAILLWFRKRKPSIPTRTNQAPLLQLVEQTGEWLDLQRVTMPAGAQKAVDSIIMRLQALTPQLRALPSNTPSGDEVRRLICEELPELVDGYQRVPVALKRQPLHGGKTTPDHHLVEGLSTVDQELERMQARLATQDLHALATQQRYLEAKYKRDGDGS